MLSFCCTPIPPCEVFQSERGEDVSSLTVFGQCPRCSPADSELDPVFEELLSCDGLELSASIRTRLVARLVQRRALKSTTSEASRALRSQLAAECRLLAAQDPAGLTAWRVLLQVSRWPQQQSRALCGAFRTITVSSRRLDLAAAAGGGRDGHSGGSRGVARGARAVPR